MKLKVFSLIISILLLSGCSNLSDVLLDEAESFVRDSIREQFENIENEIDKKNAETEGEITVDRVVDGDTFISNATGEEERYRLLLVDTPETVHPEKGEQPMGAEASEYAKERLEGETVEIEFDEEETDQYGRYLVYVYVDGELFNQELLQQGLAEVTVYEPNTRYVKEFEEIQSIAQEEEIGIWGLE